MNKDLENSNLLQANVNIKQVKEFVTQLSKIIEPHGIVMIKDGKKILDINWDPYSTKVPHVDNSVSKTFVGIAVGLIYDRGLVNLEEKVVDIFPDVDINTNNTMIHDMTVRDVLTMSMGQMNNPVLDGDRNWVSALLNNPITFKPGSMFHYDSLATYLLCAIVQKKTSEKVITILKRDLFDKIGAKDAYFLENAEGVAIGGLGLFVSTETLAKTGWMLTNKGVYNDTRILSEEWATMQISKQIDNAAFFDPKKHESRNGYCFQCWKCCNGGTRMSGLWGQMCLMMPEYNFTMAINARGSSSQPMLDIFDKTVLPALQLPESYANTEKDLADFEEFTKSLKTTVATNTYVSKMPTLISGKEVIVTTDNNGITSFKVTFENDDLLFEVVKDGKVYSAKYGHNKLEKQHSNICDLFPPYYDSLSKPKEDLVGFVKPNAYCQYYWENESTAHLEALFDNEATHFNIDLHVDYDCASFEWVPLTCFTHTSHIYVLGSYKK